jgi:hypothetical protein
MNDHCGLDAYRDIVAHDNEMSRCGINDSYA